MLLLLHHKWTYDWHISDWQFKSHDHRRSHGALSDCHWRSPVFEHEDRTSIKKGGDNSSGGTCGLLREHNENCSMSESFMIERWVHFAELMALAATRSPPLHFSMGGVPLSRLLLAESSSSCSEHHIVPSSTSQDTHLHYSFRCWHLS
jgi:hypothetical protein